ncbi:NlpC/P60 family protein [Hyphomonas sp.]|uniref:C40 family peptidase n=1 Tax=Hyphomonas sp. TaxID=87 RepID=UPI00391B2DD6
MAAADDPRLARPPGEAIAFQVTAGAVPVRKTPASDGEIATLALHGEVVEIFREEGEFGLGQCRRDGYVGWVLMEALSAPVLAATHKVGALRTYCFAEPDVKSAPLFLLSLGARVAATGQQAGVWTQCARAGWVYAPHLLALDAFEADPAAVAERFIGSPYLWGGRESLGLDCSGLIQQAFEACGVLLPRDSDQQEVVAGEVLEDWQAPGALRRGDLMFWKGHAGILTAPDELLHANAFHMATAREPLGPAMERLERVAGPVTSVRRLDLAAARRMLPVQS